MWSADLLQQKTHEKRVTCEKYKFLGPHSRVPDLVGLGCGLRICVSSKIQATTT